LLKLSLVLGGILFWGTV